jgi:hypothetical protein
VLACLVLASSGAAAVAAGGERHETRIPHLDGTGTATIVELPSNLPGASKFVRATPEPIPQPGELVLPPTPTRSPGPRPTGKPPPARPVPR